MDRYVVLEVTLEVRWYTTGGVSSPLHHYWWWYLCWVPGRMWGEVVPPALVRYPEAPVTPLVVGERRWCALNYPPDFTDPKRYPPPTW